MSDAYRTSIDIDAPPEWLEGHSATAGRIRQAAAEEGPNFAQAVAEALSAASALAAMGMWPGSRDPASESAVFVVRERWARIQRKAKRDWLASHAARKERGTREP